MEESFVVVVDGDGERTLGEFLSDDILGHELDDFAWGGDFGE